MNWFVPTTAVHVSEVTVTLLSAPQCLRHTVPTWGFNQRGKRFHALTEILRYGKQVLV